MAISDGVDLGFDLGFEFGFDLALDGDTCGADMVLSSVRFRAKQHAV